MNLKILINRLKASLLSLALFAMLINSSVLHAQTTSDYLLAGGDKVHVQVFENPDLTLDLEVSQLGMLSFPLIGEVKVGGFSAIKAARLVAESLRKGGFITNPQVTLTVTEVVGSTISVLGYVNRPGIFPLAKAKISISEALALAGDVVLGTQNLNNTQNIASAGDLAIHSGTRNGHPFKTEISISGVLANGSPHQNNFLFAGDVLYVPIAQSFFIYGQVNQPGMRKIEPNMSVAKALAMSGGLTLRGTQRNIKVIRKNAEGVPVKSVIEFTDLIQADDVIFVEESLF